MNSIHDSLKKTILAECSQLGHDQHARVWYDLEGNWKVGVVLQGGEGRVLTLPASMFEDQAYDQMITRVRDWLVDISHEAVRAAWLTPAAQVGKIRKLRTRP